MVKYIFMAFATLLILGNSVSAAPAEMDQELIKDVAEKKPDHAEVETATVVVEKNSESATIISTTSEVTTTRKPVLVLIRDALKKVTNGLPTDHVTNNALQYFQLFEHFIQQTIEQVIDAADEEDETVTDLSTVVTDDHSKQDTAEKQSLKETEELVSGSVLGEQPAKAAVAKYTN